MDLHAVLADKALLASLSREYELLKATKADVNFQEWITHRLKRAAAARKSYSTTAFKQQQRQQGRHNSHPQQQTTAQQASVSAFPLTTSNTQAHVLNSKAASSRRRSVAGAPLPSETAPAAPWQAQDITNVQHQAGLTEQTALLLNNTSSSTQPQVENQLGLQRAPGQSVQPGQTPQWVAAAKLGASLQAGSMVPLMHAAAEHERRLAAAAALAKQQLELGLEDPPAAVLAAVQESKQQLQPAAQEQLQQVVKLTQEVVQQNQLLQQAVMQQQARLSTHEDLLSSVLQQTTHPGGLQPAAPTDTASVAAAGQVGLPAVAAGGTQELPGQHAAAAEPRQQIPAVVKDSWLMQVAQQSDGRSAAAVAQGRAAAKPDAPEFIRIAGAGKQPLQQPDSSTQPLSKQQQTRSTGPDAAAHGPDASDERRRQLKGALRQLLTAGAVGPLLRGLPGLMEGLRDLQQQQQQLQQPAQDTSTQAHISTAQRTAAVSLVALLQQQRQQQQRQQAQVLGDGGQQQQQQRAQLSKAQQLVLERRKQQQQQQQEHEGGQPDGCGRPQWQSEVYVPPPSRLLRVKKAGAADVWNAAPGGAPGTQMPPRSLAVSKGQQQPKRKPSKRAAAAARSSSGGRKQGAGAGYRSSGGWRVDGGLRRPLQQQAQTQALADDASGQPHAESRLSRVEQTAAEVMHAVARLEQRLQQQHSLASSQQQQQQQQLRQEDQQHTQLDTSGAPSSDSGGGQQEADVLHMVLEALEQVDLQEREIRDRWFSSGSSSNNTGRHSSSSASQARADEVPGCQGSTGQQQPCSSSCEPQAPPYTEAAAREPAALPPSQGSQAVTAKSQSGAAHSTQPGHSADSSQQQQQPCALTAAAIRSIKAGRRRLLKHTALVDDARQHLGGSPGGGSSADGTDTRQGSGRRAGVLQPTQVVEAVADLLLDELLLGEAEELEGFCDALCSQLLEDEFEEA